MRLPGPLPRAWYARLPTQVARELIGAVLVHEVDGEALAGVIVETEAYLGPDDRASHARAGLTRRTGPMFGPAGHAYVYRLYGMHWAFNVVAHTADEEAGAVLVRAALPVAGRATQRRLRGRPDDREERLASGPGRLCGALAITGADDGRDLTTGERLWIGLPSEPEGAGIGPAAAPGRAVLVGPRINVEAAGEPWAGMPFRFGLAGSGALSRPFPGTRAARVARPDPAAPATSRKEP